MTTMMMTPSMLTMTLKEDSRRKDSVTLCKYCLSDDFALVFERRKVLRRRKTDVVGGRSERIAVPSTPFSFL